MLGFRNVQTARRTLTGVEAMAMPAKGQVHRVPGGGMQGQAVFAALFGLAA